MSLRFLMIGDIVGRPGRRVVQQQLPQLRRDLNIDLVIANAENVAGGSGITRALFRKLQSYGIDGVTLGDHALRQADIYPALDCEPNIIRPANLPESAPGQRYMLLRSAGSGGGDKQLYVLTVLGRLFMNGPPADDPFATVDLILQELDDDIPVLVEIHAEATSEKVALGHYLAAPGRRRVAAVIGTHTHIPTADAKILSSLPFPGAGGTAFITDLGMTGPYDSVLGRRTESVLKFMTTAVPERFNVAEHDVRLCAILVDLNDTGRAVKCERIEIPADPDHPPFNTPDDD
ncbi:MAG: TIGR00282 family metallophosphoesterase [Phycisphaerales bacterium]